MTRLISFCCLMAVCFVFLGPAATSGLAQSLAPAEPSAATDPEPGPPSPNDVKELIRLLADERIREWLEKGAENLSEGEVDDGGNEGHGFRNRLESFLNRTRERGRLLQEAWRNLAVAPTRLIEEWQRNLDGAGTVRSLSYVLIFLFIGGGIEWLYRQLTNRRLLSLQLGTPASLAGRLRAAAARALLLIGGLVVFAIGSIGGFLSFSWSPFVEALVLNLLILVISIRTISTLSLFLFAPRVPELRLTPFDSPLAKRVHSTLVIAFCALAVVLAVADVFSRLSSGGGQIDVEAASLSVSVFAGMICLLAALLAIWKIAGFVLGRAKAVTEGGSDASRQRVVNWGAFLSILAVLAFGLWLFAATEMMWTVLILGLLPAALTLSRAWVNYFFDEAESYLFGRDRAPAAPSSEDPDPEAVSPEIAAPDNDDDHQQSEAERRPYDTVRLVTVRFLRFVLVLAGVLLVLAAWGTDILSLSESPTFYGKVASVVIDLIVAVLIADLIWTWARASIDQRLAAYKPPEGPQAPGPEARVATLLPLLRVMLMVTLIVMVGLSVLSSIGVNIAPLIAGAGVVGVAIGFGAQSLVKDIVSGIFFLIDDAFRVGEYIEIGNLRGVVESMSVRSLRVRHHRGAVHTIPFGELTSLTNYSRDWVIMKMEFRVPFETDLKLVKKIVKRIGATMMEDPAYSSAMLEPLKSQGVRRMEEFNMVVGVKFMAKPGEQWTIRRDAYQKIVDAFEENGIRLAERNVKVQVVSDHPLSESEEKAAVSAAQDAIEQTGAQSTKPRDEP